MEITLKIKDIDETTFCIKTVGEKIMYSPDKLASDWAKDGRKEKTKDCPQLKNFNTVVEKGHSNIADNSIGFFFNTSNNIYQNSSFVALFSSGFSHGHGTSILPANFLKVIALFTARKSITPNWINCKDEYMVPNQEHTDYKQWNSDALIYALFNNSSQQSSLRDIDYKGKKWDIRNHFFWMSNKEMQVLANTGFNEMYQDCKRFPEDTYVYRMLQTITLSKDAQEVLQMARELVRKSFAMRVSYHSEHPEYHLNTWDGGWAQLKPMMKELFPTEYKAFVERYKAFETRMRQGVYRFGFLKE